MKIEMFWRCFRWLAAGQAESRFASDGRATVADLVLCCILRCFPLEFGTGASERKTEKMKTGFKRVKLELAAFAFVCLFFGL